MPLPNKQAQALDADFAELESVYNTVTAAETAPPPVVAQGEDAAYQQFLETNGMGAPTEPAAPGALAAPTGGPSPAMAMAQARPDAFGAAARLMGSQEAVDTAARSLPLAGAMAGGLGVGALTGGNPALAAGGAAFGNMAGEALLAPYKWSKGEEMKPAAQLGLESLVQGASEFAGPAVSRILNFAAKKTVGPLQRDIPIDTRVLKESVGVRKANDILKGVAGSMKPALERKYGKEVADNITEGVMMATDLTENRIMDTVENFAGNSIFGGKKIQAMREAQQDIINEIPTFIAKTYGEVLDPEDAIGFLASSIRNIDDLRRGQAGSIYDYVGNVLGDSPVVHMQRVGKGPSSFVSSLRGALNELEAQGLNIEGTSQVIDLANKLPNYASFNAAKTLRTWVGNTVRSLREVNPKNTQIAVLREIEQDLGHAMRGAVRAYDRGRKVQRETVAAVDPTSPQGRLLGRARSQATGPTSPPLSPLLRYANESYGDIENRTGNAIIEGWMESITKKNKGPEAMGKLFDTPANARLFLSTVGKQSRSADIARQWYVEDLWRSSMDNGVFNPSKFEAMLANVQKSESGVALEMFGDDGVQELKRFATGPKFIRTKDTKAGNQAARFAEAGFIVGAALAPGGLVSAAFDDKRDASMGDFGAAAGGVASYALSMRFLSRALASPGLRRFVLDSRRFGPKTERGATAVAQLMAAATKDEIAKIPQTDTREGIAARRAQLGGAQ